MYTGAHREDHWPRVHKNPKFLSYLVFLYFLKMSKLQIITITYLKYSYHQGRIKVLNRQCPALIDKNVVYL